MAETITLHHIPALAASPSVDITQGSLAGDYGVDGFDDSEFPYAHGAFNGIKCCTKCGATKTPQWREGPFGPKTLCNACGVKRTRKLRAEADGTKRRKVTSSPTGKVQVKPQLRPTHSQDRGVDSYGSHEYDEAYQVREPYYAAASPAGPRRPLRRAAEEAAVKTARYARTGEWAGEQDGNALAMRVVASPSSSDVSMPSSDCPEEVSWTPLAADAAAKSGLASMPLDCYAAVNLMTMSMRTPESDEMCVVSAFAAEAGTAEFADNTDALTAKLADLYKMVPPAKALELIRLNQELDNSLNEAQAANAAVAAVAAVLATKQAAALRARELAVAATKRLRRFTLELDTQFGINHKSLPRIRTLPKKENSHP